jgi:hypothetical protein
MTALAWSTFAAHAQTANDGLQALIRGDEVTAARLLKADAESPAPDPLAFFRAAMVQSGRGKPADPIRACGLYHCSRTPQAPVTEARRSRAMAVLCQNGLGVPADDGRALAL